MKKNTNSRKISLQKNNLWKKKLRRQWRIQTGTQNILDNNQDLLDEISMLFPNLEKGSKEISVELTDEEKKIITVNVGEGLYENDVYEELKKYKDVPMKGFRQLSKKKNRNNFISEKIKKKLGSLTLMDFRFGSQIRENIVYTKYFNEGKNKAIELYPQFKDLIAAPFNVKKNKNSSFNIIFYDNNTNADNNIRDFMMKNIKEDNTNENNETNNETNTENQ
jgi:hypothetical protein